MLENQQILNQMLYREEQALFLEEDTNSVKAARTVCNMADLIVLGAIPSDYNIYGTFIRIAEKMCTLGLSPFNKGISKDNFMRYLNSILDGDSKEIRNNSYKVLVQSTL